MSHQVSAENDTLDERGKAARDGAGSHTCLDALERELDGGRNAPRRLEHVARLNDEYVQLSKRSNDRSAGRI